MTCIVESSELSVWDSKKVDDRVFCLPCTQMFLTKYIFFGPSSDSLAWVCVFWQERDCVTFFLQSWRKPLNAFSGVFFFKDLSIIYQSSMKEIQMRFSFFAFFEFLFTAHLNCLLDNKMEAGCFSFHRILLFYLSSNSSHTIWAFHTAEKRCQWANSNVSDTMVHLKCFCFKVSNAHV